MTNTLIFLGEAAGHESGGGINPWIVGGIALGILLLMLLAVVGFGGGREHS